MIVRFKDGTNPQARAVGSVRHGTSVARTDPIVDRLAIVDVAPEGLADALSALRDDPDVLYAEPDYLLTFESIPNDPQFSGQWGLFNVRAAEAWNQWTGESAPDFRVAVIDTGVAYEHPDLAGNIWTNPLEQPGDGNGDGCPGVCFVDDDGDGLIDEPPFTGGDVPEISLVGDDDENGYVDDFHGFDFGRIEGSWVNDNDPRPEPGGEHGTKVAVVLGAVTNNGIGVSGVVWRTKIVALKISDFNGNTAVSDAWEAFDYCTRTGIRISNNSWKVKDDVYSQALYDKIAAARDVGHLVVAAVGNEGRNVDVQPTYPACFDLANIIAVGASTSLDSRWVGAVKGGSKFGKSRVDLSAPGIAIPTTTWTDPASYGYELITGTSGAAPFVTGAAALMMGKNPSWSYQLVRSRILGTARFSPKLGCASATSGILDVAAALGDCNQNQVWDATDISSGTSNDCNANGMPDECDYDCDGNGAPEVCENPTLIRACCLPVTACEQCVQVSICECTARGGYPGPVGSSCHTHDCFGIPD